ncbi:MAG: MMPL family transporter [Proteobacteria bacterium]|nr:MMPL family transporter [Pseudomonadota bacterium]
MAESGSSSENLQVQPDDENKHSISVDQDISLGNDQNYLNGAPFMERLLFSRRAVFLTIFIIVTLFLGYQMFQMKPEASYLRMIPTYHPYIKNFLANRVNLKALGNSVRICVETTEGNIFTKEYLDTLKKITDEVFYVPGVNRGSLKSLWTPQTRYTEVTVDGFEGGQVVPRDYDGSQESVDQVRLNVLRSGEIGAIVANDLKSSIIIAPLEDIDPTTRKPLDYLEFSKKIEAIRTQFQNDTIKIHITGFAKIVGDLIDGSTRVGLFFLIAFFILLFLLWFNSRCIKSTAMRAISSIAAVIWQLGIMRLFGYGLNPYSMLVPFLMFALGVSHGIQMFNAQAREMLDGADKLQAARLAYRQNYIPGLAALFTDCIGFALLMTIRIGVIQDIAVGATIGVVVVAVTDLMFLPILMSYSGISDKTIELIGKRSAGTNHPVWVFLSKFAERKYATLAVVLAVIGLLGGTYLRKDLKIGDMDPGAPELRANSRYNLDNAYMNSTYSSSSDVFVVMLDTPPIHKSDYTVVVATQLLKNKLLTLKGVEDVVTHVDFIQQLNSALAEGNLKWVALPRSKVTLENLTTKIPENFMPLDSKITPIMIFLDDHKAETLERVVSTVEEFGSKYDTKDMKFLLAAGNAGIEAATNIEVEKSLMLLTILVYAAVFLTCLITYRNFKSALCVVAPLTITSVLCEAIMTKVGIGIKVATLPVIAVGVGIGVDYGIYIYNKLIHYRNEQGHNLKTAYYLTLNTTGRAVAFTGITLSIGVATWAFSPIKFQADMGLLLTFMFLWNMVGALVLLPALVHFLIKDKKGVKELKSLIKE